MILSIYIVLLGIYLLFNFVLARGWGLIPEDNALAIDAKIVVSIIVTVRNEEKNIAVLLTSLEAQSYPKSRYEVLIFNDHSTDRTSEIIEAHSTRSKMKIILYHLIDTHNSPKKTAITQGVNNARGSWIMITDGDCQVPENWISSFVYKHSVESKAFIFGPVGFIQNGACLNKMAGIEFSSLIGAGAVSLYYQKPIMCNAANLGFSKSAFLESGGYSDNQHIASGDDVFLMKKIYKKDPSLVSFLKSREAIVLTHAEQSIQSFFHQRVRWAAKWKSVEGSEGKVIPVYIFIFHLSTLIILGMAFFGNVNLVVASTLIAIKFLAEYLVLKRVMSFLGHKANILLYFATSLLYPVYAVLIGIAANFVNYNWKGRTYKSGK